MLKTSNVSANKANEIATANTDGGDVAAIATTTTTCTENTTKTTVTSMETRPDKATKNNNNYNISKEITGNLLTNPTAGVQEHGEIIKRLERLNKWQEEQKKLLNERQSIQRQMLGMEQRSIYEKLGLKYDENNLYRDEKPAAVKESPSNKLKIVLEGRIVGEKRTESNGKGSDYDGTDIEDNDDDDECVSNTNSACAFEDVECDSDENVDEEDPALLTDGEDDNDMRLQSPKTLSPKHVIIDELCLKPKRQFLRKGEGIKQRFKIDPENLRINNLPHYKYANAHPKLQNTISAKKIPKRRIKQRLNAVKLKEDPLTSVAIDLQEQRFQKMLKSSNNACNSTPDTKSQSSFTSSTAESAAKKDKVHFVESGQRVIPTSNTKLNGPITWAKVLDAQQIKPISVQEMRNNSSINKLDESLSIFELLEQKANEGAIDMNSNCVKRFMKRKAQQQKEDTDEIPVDSHLRDTGLSPVIEEIQESDDNFNDCNENGGVNGDGDGDGDDDGDDDDDIDEQDETTLQHSEIIDNRDAISNENNADYDSDSDDGVESTTHNVRVEVNSIPKPSINDTIAVTDTSSSTTENTAIAASNQIFQHFKDALFSAIDSQVPDEKTQRKPLNNEKSENAHRHERQLTGYKFSTTRSTKPTALKELARSGAIRSPRPSKSNQIQALNSQSPTPYEDLKAKANLVKARLRDLDREIASFKDNNMQLIKAKQQHEYEKAQLEVERTELLDHIKDEKIKLEIYLHDERMKIEEEKRIFEQQLRMRSTKNKEKKEIARLKNDIEELQVALKQKEHNHVTAQTRLRVQIRTLEKDNRALQDEIERLHTENKKINNENASILRERSKKMLFEINRNIARLAPKLVHNMENENNNNNTNNNNTCTNMRPKQRESMLTNNTNNNNNQRPLSPSRSTVCRTTVRRKVTHTNLSPPPHRHNTPTHKDHPNKKQTAPQNAQQTKSIAKTIPKTTLQTKKIKAPSNKSITVVKTTNESATLPKKITSTVQATYKHGPNKSGCSTDTDDDFESVEGDLTPWDDDGIDASMINDLPATSSSICEDIAGSLNNSNATAEQQFDSKSSENDSEFKREIINTDGSKDIIYPNGNIKKISADGMLIRMLYFNKDIKETNINDGTVKYYYSESNTWHTTYLDGLEIIEFPNGQTEHRYKSGIVEVHFPNNSIKITNPSDELKLEEWRYADGTNLIQMRNGDKIITMANGQKEIHTRLSKRREYPDGTVKIVYPDGSQETRYSTGRVRLKDKDGNLVLDTGDTKCA